jgi:hypothetical protein
LVDKLPEGFPSGNDSVVQQHSFNLSVILDLAEIGRGLVLAYLAAGKQVVEEVEECLR